MSERTLYVKGFCGIKEVHLDLKKFTVFVGPQASGKSLLAKLDYFCQEVLGEMMVVSAVKGSYEEYQGLIASKLKEYFPPKTWGNGRPFHIYFLSGQVDLHIKGSPKKRTLDVVLGEQTKRQFEILSKKIKQVVSKFGYDRFIFEADEYYLSKYLMRISEDAVTKDRFVDLLFVPAGRSFFSNLDRAVWPILQRQKSIDPFLIQYGIHYEGVKGAYRYAAARGEVGRRPGQDGRATAANALWNAIGGEFVVEKDDEYVRLTDGRIVPVANLSSGQQELLPLLVGVFQNNSEDRRRAVFIEEPEAHLFPSAQKGVVEFIAAGFNGMPQGSEVVITTHSPYVLASINNLLTAQRVSRKRGRAEKVEQIYPRSYWLKSSDIACYAVCDGGAESIMDEDLQIIDASYIDSVSSEIAEDYDLLLGV